MAKCEVTGRQRQVGNNVSHANNRTKRVFASNIQKIKVRDENGNVRRMNVSAKGLKSSDDILKAAPRKVLLEMQKKDQES